MIVLSPLNIPLDLFTESANILSGMVDFFEVPHIKILCGFDGAGDSGFVGSSAAAAAEPLREQMGDRHCLALVMARERRIPSMVVIIILGLVDWLMLL